MAKRESRRNGINPLAYLGSNAYAPPNVAIYNRAPTTDDRKNVNIGDLWLDSSTDPRNVYMLVSLEAGVGTWIEISGTLEGGLTGELLTAVTGGAPAWATESDGDFAFVRTDVGDRNLVVSSSDITSLGSDAALKLVTGGATGGDPFVRFTVTGQDDWMIGIDNADNDTFKISNSSTDLSANNAIKIDTVIQAVEIPTFLQLSALGEGVCQTVADGTVFSDKGTNGQLLISSNVNEPQWGTITAGANVTVTNGDGSIEIASTASGAGAPTCSFLAHQVADGGEPNGGVYLGEDVILTEVYDVGGDFTPGDGAGTEAIFTAPQDGKYLLTYSTIFEVVGVASNVFNNFSQIETSNRTYRHSWRDNGSSRVNSEDAQSFSVIADMEAADTAKFSVETDQGAAVFQVYGDVGGTGEYRTFVSGVLLNTSNVAESYTTDAGSAVPIGGVVQVLGGTNVTTSGATNIITVNSAGGGGGGAPTSSFFAYVDPGYGTGVHAAPFSLGSVQALNELYDVGGDFTPGDGAGTAAEFVAPQDGKYVMIFQVTSNGSPLMTILPSSGAGASKRLSTLSSGSDVEGLLTTVLDLSLGDTVEFSMYYPSGFQVRGLAGAPYAGDYLTFVAGYLLNTSNSAETYTTNAGDATPVAGVINILGTGGTTTSGAGNTVTVASGSSVCSFLAYKAGAAVYDPPIQNRQLGTEEVLVEQYDVGNNLFPGDGAGSPAVFTAPQNSKYLLTAAVYTTRGGVWIETSNGTYAGQSFSSLTSGTGIIQVSIVADMNLGDTATFWYGSSDNTALGDADSSIGHVTYISGVLL